MQVEVKSMSSSPLQILCSTELFYREKSTFLHSFLFTFICLFTNRKVKLRKEMSSDKKIEPRDHITEEGRFYAKVPQD